MGIFEIIKSTVSAKEWDKLCAGCFAPIFQVANGMQLHGALVHTLLLHEVKIEKEKELWFNVGGELVKFTLMEFAAITGLRCCEYCDEPGFEIPETKMEDVLGVNSCTLTELKEIFRKEKDVERRYMLAHLLVLEGVLLSGRSESLSPDFVALAGDMELFQEYPWGRLVFNATIESLKKVSVCSNTNRPGFNLHGYPLAFQV